MIRARLRGATHAVHERMHGHPGFAAAAIGAIKPDEYRDLLARLYGFHSAFDKSMRAAPAELAEGLELSKRSRTGLIAEDLAGLGVKPANIDQLQRLAETPAPRSKGELLGALYVVEGSTLGGAVIARALAPVAGAHRRFFLGHGSEQGRLWRAFLAQLERLESASAEAEAAERASVATFAAFERWMADWRGACAKAMAEA